MVLHLLLLKSYKHMQYIRCYASFFISHHFKLFLNPSNCIISPILKPDWVIYLNTLSAVIFLTVMDKQRRYTLFKIPEPVV